MIDKVKLALRISTNAFNSELEDLIAAAMLDLGIAGISEAAQDDPLIVRAIITYCSINFGEPSDKDYDRLKASYDEQKAQLRMATGYTRWPE